MRHITISVMAFIFSILPVRAGETTPRQSAFLAAETLREAVKLLDRVESTAERTGEPVGIVGVPSTSLVVWRQLMN